MIIDSVTFHFRQDFDDLAIRTRVLGGMSLKLMNLAKKFSLSVSPINTACFPYIFITATDVFECHAISQTGYNCS